MVDNVMILLAADLQKRQRLFYRSQHVALAAEVFTLQTSEPGSTCADLAFSVKRLELLCGQSKLSWEKTKDLVACARLIQRLAGELSSEAPEHSLKLIASSTAFLKALATPSNVGQLRPSRVQAPEQGSEWN